MRGPLWALFGNDEDTIYGPEWFNGGKRTVWTAVRWWFRNPFHNLLWHVLVWHNGPFFRRIMGGWEFYIGWRPDSGVFGIALRRNT